MTPNLNGNLGMKSTPFYKIRQWFIVTFLRRDLSMPNIVGFTNTFWKIEVRTKKGSVLFTSLSEIVLDHLKRYNLIDPQSLSMSNNPEIVLILPTGASVRTPLLVKNFDEKTYKQEGLGIVNESNKS